MPKNASWQTFDLLMTPNGFEDFKFRIMFLNKKKAQVYVHVGCEGIHNYKVLRIGRAKHGVLDRWVKQSWAHRNTFLWSIGESDALGQHTAERYPNYLSFFACLAGLNTKLHILSCESEESMNQNEKEMINRCDPIWERYKEQIKEYFDQNPANRIPIATFGGAKKAIISQRNGEPSLFPNIPDVFDF